MEVRDKIENSMMIATARFRKILFYSFKAFLNRIFVTHNSEIIFIELSPTKNIVENSSLSKIKITSR